MVMDKTSIYGFPTPTYQYGSADGSSAAAEFTSLMGGAESAIVAAVNTVSNAISVEIVNRTSADNVISNNISVVSAQLASVSAVLQGGINTVSNALSNEISNRTSAINVVSNAISIVSNALSVEISNRISADNVISNAVSVVSQAVSVVSQAVSVVSAAMAMKTINADAQVTISASAGVTISGVSLPLASGSNYYFQFVIPFTHSVTTGITLGVTGPAMTAFVAKTQIPTTGTANATTYAFGVIGAINAKVSTTSNALSGTTLLAIVDGYANPSAPGSLHVVIGPTVAATALMVLKGAMGIAWKIS